MMMMMTHLMIIIKFIIKLIYFFYKKNEKNYKILINKMGIWCVAEFDSNFIYENKYNILKQYILNKAKYERMNKFGKIYIFCDSINENNKEYEYCNFDKCFINFNDLNKTINIVGEILGNYKTMKIYFQFLFKKLKIDPYYSFEICGSELENSEIYDEICKNLTYKK